MKVRVRTRSEQPGPPEAQPWRQALVQSLFIHAHLCSFNSTKSYCAHIREFGGVGQTEKKCPLKLTVQRQQSVVGERTDAKQRGQAGDHRGMQSPGGNASPKSGRGLCVY